MPTPACFAALAKAMTSRMAAASLNGEATSELAEDVTGALAQMAARIAELEALLGGSPPAAPKELLAELSVLEDVCAAYARDEDRYLAGEGEPYGSIPTEIGMKARFVLRRVKERECAVNRFLAGGIAQRVEREDS
jgi:hypothetical protein